MRPMRQNPVQGSHEYSTNSYLFTDLNVSRGGFRGRNFFAADFGRGVRILSFERITAHRPIHAQQASP